jgi:N-methylhydantoinase B
MTVNIDYDPITAEVINMAFQGIVAEMGITIERTSGSPGVTDGKDYSCVVAKPDGGTIAYYGNNLQHLGDSLTGTREIVRTFDRSEIADGDIFIYNDPFSSGALHQADVGIQTPVIHDGELIAWIFTNVHMADIGGMSASGFAPESRDAYGEGLRIPPMKLVAADEPVQPVWDLISANVRTPIVLGDIRSMIAALSVGRRRVLEMADERSAAEMARYVGVNEKLLSDLLGSRIAEIPPGIYEHEDWVEYDPYGHMEYVHIKCALEVTEDARLIFDLEGSGPQVDGYSNASEGALVGSIMSIVLAALLPDFPVNSGVYERFEVRRGSEGQITHPRLPAGVGAGHLEAGIRALRAAHGALIDAMSRSDSEEIRSRGYALGGVSVAVIVVTGHFASGDRGYAFMLDQQSTGHGATPIGDGVAFGGIDFSIAGRQPDVEITESSGPVLYLWRREVADSGGAGAHRGGNSLETAFVPWNVVKAEIAHASTGGSIATNGVFGGYPGGTTFTEVYRDVLPEGWTTFPEPDELGAAAQQVPAKCASVSVGRRDLVRQVIAAGSGWGDPLLRPVDEVAADLERGSITSEPAAAAYGIVLGTDGTIDEPATQRRREELRSVRVDGAPQPVADPSPRVPLTVDDGTCACAFCGVAVDLSSGVGVRQIQPALDERVRQFGGEIVSVPSGEFRLAESACSSCGTLLDARIVRTAVAESR